MSQKMSSPLEHQLDRFPLLGNLNALELWPYLNFCFFGWALLVFLPRWRHTRTLSVIPPVLHAAVYVGAVFSVLLKEKRDGQPAVDFTTLTGVVAFCRDPNGVFVGWVHYIVFDLLVGRIIVFDSIERGASLWSHCLLVVPCLFFTLMLGPSAWLAYMCLRSIFLRLPADSQRPKQA